VPKLQQIIFPKRIQEYFRSIFLLREELDKRFQNIQIMESEFMLFAFDLKADLEKAPENVQMELINLNRDTKINQKFSETKLQDFYSYLSKEKFPLLGSCVGTVLQTGRSAVQGNV
jgi:AAA15 family ATPase/GTPase